MLRAVLCVALIWSHCLLALPVTVNVTAPKGSPIKSSVVVLMPKNGLSDNERTAGGTRKPAIMNQIDKQFVPHILAIQTNSQVTFPNSDNIFHHIYSFSPAKQFEVKLYKEFKVDPVTFSEPGLVDLGCNIHDWMLGYIYVTDSPYFALTDEDGNAKIDVPDGDYIVTAWHPRMQQRDIATEHALHVAESTSLRIQLAGGLVPRTDFEDGFEGY